MGGFTYPGMVRVYECTDWLCQENCRQVARNIRRFGVCKRHPTCPNQSEVYHCTLQHTILRLGYMGSHCQGRPSVTENRNRCYTGPHPMPNRYYKFDCIRIVERDRPDLRLLTMSDAQSIEHTV